MAFIGQDGAIGGWHDIRLIDRGACISLTVHPLSSVNHCPHVNTGPVIRADLPQGDGPYIHGGTSCRV